ncbi:MAG: LLM class flavin-dependent oxidoreductase [Caldilineaceae bacterium]
MMQFGLSLPIHRQFADPQLHVTLAVDAEQAGWDGYFVWDHIAWKRGATHVPVTDPWIVLAAIAATTERMALGPLVTPLARRRPWKVARETVALDHLSKGRVILGVGLGAVAKTEFRALGEEGDDKIRGRQLDEALAVITGLWRGEPFRYEGEFYQITEAHFLPTPVQTPHIPIWVAGSWRGAHKRKPFRRAARYEGTFPFIPHREATPADFAEIIAYISRHRTSDQPIEVVCRRALSDEGIGTVAEIQPFAAVGVTWWMVSAPPGKLDLSEVRRLIQRGPPRG